MQWPSITLILSQLFLGYIVYLIYFLSLLFVTPSCEEGKICLTSYLSRKPPLQLYMYTSVRKNPSERDINLVYTSQRFNYSMSQNIPLTLDIPQKTQQNGTMFLHVILIPDSRKYGRSFIELLKIPHSSYAAIKMTQYTVPEAKAFNLLGEDTDTRKSKQNFVRPVSHIKSKVAFTVMTDDVKLPIDNIPMELLRYIRPLHDKTFSPIVISDFLQTRYRDLVKIVPQTDTMNITVLYNPISIEKLRLTLHVETTMQNLKSLGFSDKDIDEVKGLFADTNIYLLGGTFFIAAVHQVFDFLAFKNDVNFWRKKDNLIGVSKWTVIWRTFSQTIIFLYLLDEGSSLLVLIPTGIGSIIEMWKLKKILKAKFVSRGGIIPRVEFSKNVNTAEMKTREFDSESMRYLSYLLYPLVIVGAVYSLFYKPHKSWYSWSINCLVSGVYAFGFLFMLPQLFVNYKLKSVAHLPWRAFMYKAFNTFIDDVFAFIITMPVAHRIACFRDDVVFLVYLYQRWLYPVDKSRTDTDVIEQSVDFGDDSKKEK